MPYEQSIIIYQRSIMTYFYRHVIFSFLYAIWTVDHNWLKVDHDLPCSCTTCRSIIIYHRSIMIYSDRHFIFSFLYTLWTVDHTWQTVDHDLSYIHFFSKNIVFFPSVMVYERSIVIYYPTKSGQFAPKSLYIFQMLPKHMNDRPTGISYFCSQVFTNLLFSKRGANFNFLRQNKNYKIRLIIS